LRLEKHQGNKIGTNKIVTHGPSSLLRLRQTGFIRRICSARRSSQNEDWRSFVRRETVLLRAMNFGGQLSFVMPGLPA